MSRLRPSAPPDRARCMASQASSRLSAPHGMTAVQWRGMRSTCGAVPAARCRIAGRTSRASRRREVARGCFESEQVKCNEFSCVCACADPRGCEACRLCCWPRTAPWPAARRRPPPHARRRRTSRPGRKSRAAVSGAAALGAHASGSEASPWHARRSAGGAPESCVERVGGGGARLSDRARGHVLRRRGVMRPGRGNRADVYLFLLYINTACSCLPNTRWGIRSIGRSPV